jgi:hypothetical protein
VNEPRPSRETQRPERSVPQVPGSRLASHQRPRHSFGTRFFFLASEETGNTRARGWNCENGLNLLRPGTRRFPGLAQIWTT